jgi:hypothetical protein
MGLLPIHYKRLAYTRASVKANLIFCTDIYVCMCSSGYVCVCMTLCGLKMLVRATQCDGYVRTSRASMIHRPTHGCSIKQSQFVGTRPCNHCYRAIRKCREEKQSPARESNLCPGGEEKPDGRDEAIGGEDCDEDVAHAV